MASDHNDNISQHEIEERIDDAIILNMIMEEENKKQPQFTSSKRKHTSGNMSTFEAVICTVGGLLLACLLVSLLGIKAGTLTSILVIILWPVIAYLIAKIIHP